VARAGTASLFLLVPVEIFFDGFLDDPGNATVLFFGIPGKPVLKVSFHSYGWKCGITHFR
jgi:hypothetical protein